MCHISITAFVTRCYTSNDARRTDLPWGLQVAQVLFPALLAIVSSPGEYGPSVRRRALQIVHSMAVMLAGVRSSIDRESSAAIAALLDAWFQPFCAILSQPTTAHVPCFPRQAIPGISYPPLCQGV